MIFKKHAEKNRFSFILLAIFILCVHPVFSQTINKKKGKVTIKYVDGNKQASGKVKNFQKQGTWKYWNEAGKLEKTIVYKDDKKNGKFVFYYDNGDKAEEGNYVIDKKDGEWKNWYKGNIISEESHFDAGKRTGIRKNWYINGQLMEQGEYDNDVIVYDWTWFDNGKPKEVKSYKNGLADGTWRIYADPKESNDTLPMSIDNYSNGMKNGLHSAYKNGKLTEEINFKNDKLDGAYNKYNANGMFIFSENYADGNLDGQCRYFEQGKCVKEITFSNGKAIGTEKEFDLEGKVVAMSWYALGRLDSTHHFHPNGQLSISRNYQYFPGFVKTEQFSDYKEFDPQGHLLLSGRYHFESRINDWTTYYPTGKTKSITPYVDGNIKGVYKKWYANGKELLEMKCVGNAATAAPKVWDENGKVVKEGTKQYQEIVDSTKPGEIYNDPRKYIENRTELPNTSNPGDENKNAVHGRGGGQKEVAEIGNEDAPPPVEEINVMEDTTPAFQYAEQMPEFPGGSEAMMKYLASNVRYPQTEKEAGKEGTVYMSFIVEKDGSVSNIKAMKEVEGAPGFTKEAIRVVSTLPKFIPGRMNGKIVRVQYQLPIKFRLN
jgi:TonB family protein